MLPTATIPWTEEDERRYREELAKATRPRIAWWKRAGFIVAWLILLGILNQLFGTTPGGWLI